MEFVDFDAQRLEVDTAHFSVGAFAVGPKHKFKSTGRALPLSET